MIDGSLYDTRIVQSDLCAFLESYSGIIEGRKLIMTANLPYIPDQTFDENSPANVQKWEPRFAFVGGDDGLDLYRKMFAQGSGFRFGNVSRNDDLAGGYFKERV